jgi:oligoendopeptidase F
MTQLELPTGIESVDARKWESFAPFYEELQQRSPGPADAHEWLRDWSRLTALTHEAGALVYINKTLDTTDPQREEAFLAYVENVEPKLRLAEQALKERLLALVDAGADLGEGMAQIIRHMRTEAELFREQNVPLFTELAKLSNEYDNITGGLQTEWNGETRNLNQLGALLQEKERPVRERAWRAISDLWLGQREALNGLYGKMLGLRRQVAANAGLPDFRAYVFREYGRYDYTPEDCYTFHDAIEEAVVPAASRIYRRKQEQLGVERLRPWDVDVEPGTAPPLKPYQGQDELIHRSLELFQKVDAPLGRHFAVMADEELLDLDTRPGKSLGGYCHDLPLRKRPFIFMNGVGIHDDVQTLLHEAGHAFHYFEAAARQPFVWQAHAPMEFSEVASMSMELLAAPYLTREHGGFYTPAEAARARIGHLEGILLFLPYMAVVDAFQHWVYTHAEEAMNPTACDETWDRLWARFMPGVDWSGLEDARMTGWHRKLHIFHAPFYYVEYGMAQIGALQVWRNALNGQQGAVADYRSALSLGGTESLPDLFAAAGAEFHFSTPMVSTLVELVEETIDRLESERDN